MSLSLRYCKILLVEIIINSLLLKLPFEIYPNSSLFSSTSVSVTKSSFLLIRYALAFQILEKIKLLFSKIPINTFAVCPSVLSWFQVFIKAFIFSSETEKSQYVF
ncbi:MAG: hypothetical protein ACPHY8_03610 [Patescibacteria group bacterium]